MTAFTNGAPSNYAGGFNGDLVLRGTPISITTSKPVFWVNSNGGPTGQTGNFGKFTQPFSSLANALAASIVTQYTKGVVIRIGRYHAESVTTAGGINIPSTMPGIEIIGEGTGQDRPVFTFSGSTAATITMQAADCTLQNVVITNTLDQVVSPIVISAAGCTVDCEFLDSASNVEFVRGILTTAGATNLKLRVKYRGQTGGSHCVNAIRLVGANVCNIDINAFGKCSTAWVEFVTTACAGVTVDGYMFCSGTTNASKDVVDTITGSTWFANVYDGSAGYEIIGGSAVALTANSPASTTGTKSDAAVYVPGTTSSLFAYVKGTADLQEKVALSSTAVLATNTSIFTVSGGAIEIMALASVCIVGGDATAATLAYNVVPTSGSAQTISGASASLSAAAAGASVTLAGTALATAALLNANGPGLMANPGTIFCPAGTIKTTIASGPTVTATYQHILRYKPLQTGVTVTGI